MHILVIPGSFPSVVHPFAGIFFQQLTDAMQESGFKMGVIAPDIRPFKSLKNPGILNQFGKKYSYQTNAGVPVLRKTAINLAPGIRMFNQKVFVAFCHQLFDDYISKYGEPDLIHAHTSLWAGLAAKSLSRQHLIPYFVTEHSSDILRNKLSRYDNALVNQVFQEAEVIIAVSASLQKAIENNFRFKTLLVPNMVDFDKISPCNGESNKLITIGNLLPVKGYEFLIDAFAICLKEEKDLSLTIIGDGPERKKLEHKCASLGISNQVEFKGMLSPELTKEELRNHGIFISSSLFETFGVALVEALGSGMPSIATKSGGPEGIINEMNGRLCEKANANALSTEILYVYRNYQAFDRDLIRQNAIERFGKRTVIQLMKTIVHGIRR
jgi:L-malate glycosyltransferase